MSSTRLTRKGEREGAFHSHRLSRRVLDRSIAPDVKPSLVSESRADVELAASDSLDADHIDGSPRS